MKRSIQYEPYIIESGIIMTVGDLVRLNIIDWTRFKPYWKSEQDCIDRLGSHFAERFSYKIIKNDMFGYPERDDFPGWKHVGQHEIMGRAFWNQFQYIYSGHDAKLYFHDSPDFSGSIKYDGIKYWFTGDIGKVSPIAMRESLGYLIPYREKVKDDTFTLWISVIDEHTQIHLARLVPKDPDMEVLTAFESGYDVDTLVPINRTDSQPDKALAQLTLF